MPRSRLKTSPKAVPASAKKKPSSPQKAQAAETSSSLPKESEFAIGDRVSHPKFGSGIVRQIDCDKLTIAFEGKVSKQIVDYYVKRNSR